MTRFPLVILTVVLLCLQGASALTISGLVEDGEGAPLSGATLWAVQGTNIMTTTSSDGGLFFLEELHVGNVLVVGYKEDFGIAGAQAPVAGDTGVKLILPKAESLRYRIRNGQSIPVAGARVRYLRMGKDIVVPAEILEVRGLPSARSSDDGTLTLPYLPVGEFVSAVFTHPDYADTHLPPMPVGGEHPAVMLVGGKALGRVVSNVGAGIGDAVVNFYRVGSTTSNVYTSVVTDPDGFFVLQVPPGIYGAEPQHADFVSTKLESFRVETDSEPARLELVMEPVHWVEGRILQEDDTPVSFAWVSHLVEESIHAEAISGEDGGFRIGLPQGRGVLRVTPPDGFMTVSHPDTPITVSSRPIITIRKPIRVKALPRIEGVVKDVDGNPASPVLVHSVGEKDLYWTTTDAEGRFSIQLPRVPYSGTLKLRAEHGLRFQRADLTLTLSALVPLELNLQRYDPMLYKNDPDAVANDMAAMDDKPAPELACEAWFNLPEGQESLSLADLKGKVVVLTLWGAFGNNGPERVLLEEQKALHMLYGDVEDIEIISVHDRGITEVDALGYVREFGIDFPVGYDAVPSETFDRYNTSVIPQTVVIDRKGVLRYFDVTDRLPELIKDVRRAP